MTEAIANLPDQEVEAISVKTIEEVLSNSLQQWSARSEATDRRLSPRVPFQQRICLIGLDEHHCPDSGACLVDGRDISAEGISFKHHDALPNRFVALSFQTGKGIETAFVKLSWCLFSREGFYTSGGRFVRANATVDVPENWEALPKG